MSPGFSLESDQGHCRCLFASLFPSLPFPRCRGWAWTSSFWRVFRSAAASPQDLGITGGNCQRPRLRGRRAGSQLLPPLSVFLVSSLFFFFLGRAAWHVLPQPGIEPVPPAVEARSTNYWAAREVLPPTSLRRDAQSCSLLSWASPLGRNPGTPPRQRGTWNSS